MNLDRETTFLTLVKGHRMYRLKNFREDVTMLKGTKFHDDRPIRSRVILGNPDGASPPPVGEG